MTCFDVNFLYPVVNITRVQNILDTSVLGSCRSLFSRIRTGKSNLKTNSRLTGPNTPILH